VDTIGKKEKRTSSNNVDARCTSSHENKTFRSRPMVKQKGMVLGFRKTATGVTRPERRIDNMTKKDLNLSIEGYLENTSDLQFNGI
jgi:hypothetical protein